jgi:hypothetical protein
VFPDAHRLRGLGYAWDITASLTVFHGVRAVENVWLCSARQQCPDHKGHQLPLMEAWRSPSERRLRRSAAGTTRAIHPGSAFDHRPPARTITVNRSMLPTNIRHTSQEAMSVGKLSSALIETVPSLTSRTVHALLGPRQGEPVLVTSRRTATTRRVIHRQLPSRGMSSCPRYCGSLVRERSSFGSTREPTLRRLLLLASCLPRKCLHGPTRKRGLALKWLYPLSAKRFYNVLWLVKSNRVP